MPQKDFYLDALFDEIGDPTHEQALALYGYLTGLHYAGAMELVDCYT